MEDIREILDFRLEVLDKAINIAMLNRTYEKDEPKVTVEKVTEIYEKLLKLVNNGLSI